jgi:hypothetical protein
MRGPSIVLFAVLSAALVLAQGGISGTAVDVTGAVIPKATVSISSGEFRTATETNEVGRFAVTGLTGGTYSLEIWASGFTTTRIRVSLNSAEDKRLPDVLLQIGRSGCAWSPRFFLQVEGQKGGGRIRGQLFQAEIDSDTRKILPGREVRLRSLPGDRPVLTATTDADGRFEFPTPGLGAYLVETRQIGEEVWMGPGWDVMVEPMTEWVCPAVGCREGERKIVVCE